MLELTLPNMVSPQASDFKSGVVDRCPHEQRGRAARQQPVVPSPAHAPRGPAYPIVIRWPHSLNVKQYPSIARSILILLPPSFPYIRCTSLPRPSERVSWICLPGPAQVASGNPSLSVPRALHHSPNGRLMMAPTGEPTLNGRPGCIRI